MSVHYAGLDRPPRTPWLPWLSAREAAGVACLVLAYARNLTRRRTR